MLVRRTIEWVNFLEDALGDWHLGKGKSIMVRSIAFRCHCVRGRSADISLCCVGFCAMLQLLCDVRKKHVVEVIVPVDAISIQEIRFPASQG